MCIPNIKSYLFQDILARNCYPEWYYQVPAHCGPFCEAHQLVQDMYIRLKLKFFYSLNQSVLLHLLSKFLAFLAFIAFKGLKRPKKAEKKTFAK